MDPQLKFDSKAKQYIVLDGARFLVTGIDIRPDIIEVTNERGQIDIVPVGVVRAKITCIGTWEDMKAAKAEVPLAMMRRLFNLED